MKKAVLTIIVGLICISAYPRNIGWDQSPKNIGWWQGGTPAAEGCDTAKTTAWVAACTVGVSFTKDRSFTFTPDSAVHTGLPVWVTETKSGANVGRLTGTPTDTFSKTGYLLKVYDCGDSVLYYDTLSCLDTNSKWPVIDSIIPDSAIATGGDTIRIYDSHGGFLTDAQVGIDTCCISGENYVDSTQIWFLFPGGIDTGAHKIIVINNNSKSDTVDFRVYLDASAGSYDSTNCHYVHNTVIDSLKYTVGTPAPDSVTWTGHATGLSIDKATGHIYGTPGAVGIFSDTVTPWSGGAAQGKTYLTITVYGVAAPTISYQYDPWNAVIDSIVYNDATVSGADSVKITSGSIAGIVCALIGDTMGDLSGASTESGGGSLQITAYGIDTNKIIYLTYAIPDTGDTSVQCTVTVAAGDGGTVAPSGAQADTCGDTLEAVASPGVGYRFSHWDRGGVTLAWNDSTNDTVHAWRTDSAVGTVTLTARFDTVRYVLTVNRGTGDGTYDSNTVATIAPDAAGADSEYVAWSVSGTAVFNADSTEDTVRSTHTITATYRIKAPVISYAGSPAICSTTVVFSLAASNTGGPGAFRAIDALPAGLTVSSSTGTISGIPTTVTAKAGYAIQDSNSTAIDTTICTLTVVVGKPKIAYQKQSWALTVGTTTGRDSCISTGGALDSVDLDTIPAGMALDSNTWALYVDSLTDTGSWTCIFQAGNASGIKKDTVVVDINEQSNVSAIARKYYWFFGNGLGFK